MEFKKLFNEESIKKILYVKNMPQKIIFYCEMKGQMSDGAWENSRPDDHYKAWMLDWDAIIVNPNKIGTIGINRFEKRNYDFSSPKLLSIVGHRIIIKINLWKNMGRTIEKILEGGHHAIPDSVEAYDRIVVNADGGDQFWKKYYEKLNQAGISRDDIVAAEKGPYTMSNLKSDCNGLKECVKTFIE